MKKSLILGLLSLAAVAVTSTSRGQGVIKLDNYDSYGPPITYGGAGVPANGTSGGNGTIGAPVSSGSWTVGVYFVQGTVAIGSDPNSTPIGDPSTFSGGLVLGTGAGSTAGLADAAANHTAGQFIGSAWGIPGSSALGGQTYTLEIVAYSGATYASSNFRGHSTAFQVTTSANTAISPNITGSLMPTFGVFVAVPEPSVLALSAVGAAAMMLIRRKKA